MKTLIALAIMMTFGLAQASETTLSFILQTNHPFCGSTLVPGMICPPEGLYQAGVMATAHTDDPDVVGFLFTVTAISTKDGTPLSGTTISEKWVGQYYASGVVWLGRETSDFRDVKVTGEALRRTGAKATADSPGIEVRQFAAGSNTLRFDVACPPFEICLATAGKK
jgi:hypothetical protein